jgi:5-methylthioadenosine/S-adenosylhomocysteine deaminase
MGERRAILRDGAVVVDGGMILAVEKRGEVFQSFVARKVLGGPDKVVFPGPIDCHNHPIHYLSKGMIDDMRFPERWRDGDD